MELMWNKKKHNMGFEPTIAIAILSIGHTSYLRHGGICLKVKEMCK